MRDKIAPIHPGEILMEEFLQPLGVTQNRLAVSIDVPPRRITADTALRLGRFFGTSAQFWVNLQSHYDLEVELDALGDELTRIQPLHST